MVICQLCNKELKGLQGIGNDLFNQKDFNKNNFRKTIPNPKIIYNDGRLVVYGAGMLRRWFTNEKAQENWRKHDFHA